MESQMFRSITLLMFALSSAAGFSQARTEKVQTGIAPVNDIRMYYEIRGKGNVATDIQLLRSIKRNATADKKAD